jgi:hypothetical protein
MARRSVKIWMVRHYWEGGENARWKSAAEAPAEIVRAIKDEFPILMASQPEATTIGAYRVILRYEAESDRFNRPATAFHAAVFLNAESSVVEEAVRLHARSMPRDSLEATIQVEAPALSLPDGEGAEGSKAKGDGLAKFIPKLRPAALVWGVAGIAALASIALLAGNFRWADRPAQGGAGAGLCAQIQEAALRTSQSNCALEAALRACATPGAELPDRDWRQLTNQNAGIGYCAAYASLPERDQEAFLARDLSVTAPERRVAEQWGRALGLSSSARAEIRLEVNPIERPLPQPIPPARLEAWVRQLSAMLGVNGEARLAKTWNDALQGARELERHRLVGERADAAEATIIAYISDYCAVVEALVSRRDATRDIHFNDALLNGVVERQGGHETLSARHDACRQALDRPGEQASISALTGARSSHDGILNMVRVVDLCALIDLNALHTRGVSPAIANCRDAARVLGVAWRETGPSAPSMDGPDREAPPLVQGRARPAPTQGGAVKGRVAPSQPDGGAPQNAPDQTDDQRGR